MSFGKLTGVVIFSSIALTACPTPQPQAPDAGDLTPAAVVQVGGPHAVVVGKQITLAAITEHGSDASYTWTSPNNAIAVVDAGGTVRGIAPGEVIIRVTGDDTGKSATHPVVVEAAPQPVVAIAGAHRVQIGANTELVALTVNGNDVDYLWTSDNASVATVVDGVVTGIDVGDTLITATGIDTGAIGSFSVAVVGTSAVVVNGPFYLPIGQTAQLSAQTVNDVDELYIWSSDDDAVATVNEQGLVRAVSTGEATFTATGVTSGLSGTLGIVVQQTIPHFDEWQSSGHADYTAEPFNHWNEEGEVPTSCARCHSDQGYRDYIGADGSAVGVVDAPAPIGHVIECTTCHNSATDALTSVTFPSGKVVDELGAEARCMTCHQGRASTKTVDDEIVEAGVGDDDVSTDLGFINIHYYAAGATLMAGRAEGAYQYAGNTYDVRFRHVPERDTCIECHDQHTLKIRINACQGCHANVATTADLKNIRMMSSLHTDYDGDGNLQEGIYYEMVGVRAAVLDRLQAYGREKGTPICYDTNAYPYFFKDTDDSGVCESAEKTNGNKFTAWTPRMLRAAYNIHVSEKDPGAFAHNAKYIIEALFDSANDVNGALAAPATLTLHRNDPGHFNGSGEPARHWDEEEGVNNSCSRCHGASEGFRFYLTYGVGERVLEQGNGLDCATCHDTFENFNDEAASWNTVRIDSVLFPSGARLTRAGDKGNICATCHQGRESKVSVDSKIAGVTNGRYSFVNIHYLPAGAMRMGSFAKGGYEYDGKDYVGEMGGHLGGNSCVDCHSPQNTSHTFLVEDNVERCQLCHVDITAPEQIRASRHFADYDGDGNANELMKDELAGLADALIDEINSVSGACYGEGYPYFFVDSNGSGGHCDPGETSRFSAFTPDLVKAAYNYQLWHVEPGAWAHNYDYMAQLLIDSIEDLGGDVSNFVRP